MAKIVCKEGGNYSSYASGSGAISFVHEFNGTATANKITREIAEQLMPAGWLLTNHNGQWEAYKPVKRHGESELIMDNEIYRYEVQYRAPTWVKYAFYYQNKIMLAMRFQKLENISMAGALEYYLQNEAFLTGNSP
jgi:hypothetical protein